MPAGEANNCQQAAVLALRRGAGDVEVCLIRRRGARKWGIPKGFVDLGHTLEQAALNEAFEEAGLRGQLLGDAIGTYQYKKWGDVLTVAVYLMEVLEEEDQWLEMKFRVRTWFSLANTALRLADHPVRPLLDDVKQRLGPWLSERNRRS
jgi:8-oxo-dGTP pyrophosphatase MutT (NUDIX family)